jgi:HlyD family secretion protein
MTATLSLRNGSGALAKPALPDQPRTNLGAATRIGMLGSIAMMGVFLAWAHFTPISGAVVTPGQAVVPGKPRVVQSLDGGEVLHIRVANGDRVQAGQVLLQLDPTLIKAKRDMAMNRLAAALALRARLEAEQTGLATPAFAAPDLPFAAPDMAQAEAGQRQIFAARDALREGRHAQLAERVAQLKNQIDGADAQIAAKAEQLTLVEKELATTEQLFAKGMVREAQKLDLQSSRAGLMGEIAGDKAERARLENAIRDAGLEVDQADRAFLEQVATDLRTTMTEAEELVLEIITLNDQLSRVDIKAPADGIVHEMQVTTEGGVVAPGAVMMQIVPQTGVTEFELRLSAQDIDRVHVAQGAQLVFPSLDPRTTPRLEAKVATISPAAITDPQTGQSFYRLTLSVTPEELHRLKGVEILPGMPVEAFLQTGDRSVLSYLLAPMSHQLMRAFREE